MSEWIVIRGPHGPMRVRVERRRRARPSAARAMRRAGWPDHAICQRLGLTRAALARALDVWGGLLARERASC